MCLASFLISASGAMATTIMFNKDTPQPWFDAGSSFDVSVTDEGKVDYGTLLTTLQADPSLNVQLEGHGISLRIGISLSLKGRGGSGEQEPSPGLGYGAA